MKTDEIRKGTPIYGGFLSYFPRAVAEVARLSVKGNEQHLNGEKLHWDRTKSNNHLESLTRHLLDVAFGEEVDDDGTLHRAKMAWRSLASLEIYLENNELQEKLENSVSERLDYNTEVLLGQSARVASDPIEEHNQNED